MDGRIEHPVGRYEIEPLTPPRFIAVLLVFVYHAPLAQPFAHHNALGQAGSGSSSCSRASF